jgi:hypothetical protein
VAKAARPERIDPHWPEAPEGHDYPVSELASHTQGALSAIRRRAARVPQMGGD